MVVAFDSYQTTRPPPGPPPGSERLSAAAEGRSQRPGHGGTAGSCRTFRRTHTRVSAETQERDVTTLLWPAGGDAQEPRHTLSGQKLRSFFSKVAVLSALW